MTDRLKAPLSHMNRLLSRDDLQRLNDASLRVLEQTGIRMDWDEARRCFLKAGAGVTDNIVHIPAKMVEHALTTVPSEIILYGRGASPPLYLDGNHVYTGTGGAAITVLDLKDLSPRPAVLNDVYNIARLVDQLEHIDFFVRPVVAGDIPKMLLDINKYYASLAGTDKHVMGSAYSVEAVGKIIELASMVVGDRTTLARKPCISFISSCLISPLRFDTDSTRILTEILEHRIPVVIGSAPMAGSTAPVTLAGTLVQLNAEVLAGIVYSQLVEPGAPVIYGAVPSTMEFHGGGFCAGAVEYGLLNSGASQLARYNNIPAYNSAGVSDSKLPDIQAGYEKASSLFQTVPSGIDLIHHAAGMLESLRTVAYEQYVIDNEIIAMAKRAARGMEISEETLALDLIAEVGHGGSFLTEKHTRRNMRRELFFPRLADRNSRVSWEKGGCLDGRERARQIAAEILAQPPICRIPTERDTLIRGRFPIMLINGK